MNKILSTAAPTSLGPPVIRRAAPQAQPPAVVELGTVTEGDTGPVMRLPGTRHQHP